MTDRAQDTEAIRAALSYVLDDVSGAAVASDTRVHLARAALDRLVARLEAAERALEAALRAERSLRAMLESAVNRAEHSETRLEAAGQAYAEIERWREAAISDYRDCEEESSPVEAAVYDYRASAYSRVLDLLDAPLAAAAPGETGCKGLWPGCMDDGCEWPNGPCAAP